MQITTVRSMTISTSLAWAPLHSPMSRSRQRYEAVCKGASATARRRIPVRYLLTGLAYLAWLEVSQTLGRGPTFALIELAEEATPTERRSEAKALHWYHPPKIAQPLSGGADECGTR